MLTQLKYRDNNTFFTILFRLSETLYVKYLANCVHTTNIVVNINSLPPKRNKCRNVPG